ncbi:Holin-like protein CidA [compost metagenome]
MSIPLVKILDSHEHDLIIEELRARSVQQTKEAIQNHTENTYYTVIANLDFLRKKVGGLSKLETTSSMKFLLIFLQICILYVFSFIGNAIHNFFNLAIPGSIIALLFLFICLCLKIIPVSFIEHGAGFLLSILTLFFTPAAVGIMNYPSLLSLQGALLVLVVLLSTIITIAIAGITSTFIEKKKHSGKDEDACNSSFSHSG